MDKQTWQFINTFAPWLSALGTLSAVVVSLYLATKDRRINLNVSASIHLLVQAGRDTEEFVTISAVNMGRREVTITSVGWKLGLLRTTRLWQNPGVPWSTTLPARLRDGESATFLMPIKPDALHVDCAAELRKHLGKFSKLNSYSLKAQVHTSIGRTFFARADRSLRSLLTQRK